MKACWDCDGWTPTQTPGAHSVWLLLAQVYAARLQVRALTAPESLVFHRYWSWANLLAALMKVLRFCLQVKHEKVRSPPVQEERAPDTESAFEAKQSEITSVCKDKTRAKRKSMHSGRLAYKCTNPTVQRVTGGRAAGVEAGVRIAARPQRLIHLTTSQ